MCPIQKEGMLSTIIICPLVVIWLEEAETTGRTKIVVVVAAVVAEVDAVEVVGHIVEADTIVVDVVRVACWCCRCCWHTSLKTIETG